MTLLTRLSKTVWARLMLQMRSMQKQRLKPEQDDTSPVTMKL